MASDRTKQCKTIVFIFGLLHFLALFGAFIYFIPHAFAVGSTASKVVLSFAIAFSIVLAAVSVLVDITRRVGLHKAIMWALVLAILLALESVKTFIIIMAIVSIVDELVIMPIYNHYKFALISNKEMDKRGI